MFRRHAYKCIMPAHKKRKQGGHLQKLNQVHPKDLSDDAGAASAAPLDLLVIVPLSHHRCVCAVQSPSLRMTTWRKTRSSLGLRRRRRRTRVSPPARSGSSVLPQPVRKPKQPPFPASTSSSGRPPPQPPPPPPPPLPCAPAGPLTQQRGYLTHLENSCCCRRLLASQPDFQAERSGLERVVAAGGHHCIFLPKFHCNRLGLNRCNTRHQHTCHGSGLYSWCGCYHLFTTGKLNWIERYWVTLPLPSPLTLPLTLALSLTLTLTLT